MCTCTMTSRRAMSQSHPAWVQQYTHTAEANPLLGGQNGTAGVVDYYNDLKGKFKPTTGPAFNVELRGFFNARWYALMICVYLTIIAVMADGQSHLDYGISIDVWATVACISQTISTIYCAYYWGRLRGNTDHPIKAQILILSTVTTVMLFKMAMDIYFIEAYARFHDTQSLIDTFAQRQFEALFNLINVSTVTVLPYAAYFFVAHYSTGSKFTPPIKDVAVAVTLAAVRDATA